MKPKSLNYTSYVSLLLLLGLLLFSNNIFCQKKYVLQYNLSGKDTLYKLQQLDLKLNFDTKQAAQLYLNQLPAMLLNKGFPAASVDSVFYDSTSAKAILFLGEQYKWAQINTDSIEQEALASIGWNEKQFDNKKMDFNRLEVQQERILNYYENSGYPFAEVSLENIDISADKIKGDLRIKKGILYHIDSIKIIGTVKIKNSFLQHYLGIFNGSVYNNQKIKEISTRISELPFLQETQRSNITMLGSGATLNVYLQPKRSSEINVLVGFLPGNAISTKSQLTADVHLNLNNALGSGENILLNWQQLQPQSPRLNLGYTHPYIFNSNFGINFSFDLLKRDSAYLQLNSIIAIQYVISPSQTFKVFYQNENSFLLSGGVDTNQVLYSKRLPPNIDVTSGNIGIGYHFVKTDYRLNPRKGNELDIIASAGIKKTSKNNDIVNLKDPNEPTFDFNSFYDTIKLKTYQFKIVTSAASLFSLW